MNTRMKIVFAVLFVSLFSFNTFAQKLDKLKIEDHKDSISYAIGLDIAENFGKQGIEIDPLIMAKAMLDYASTNSLMTTEKKTEVIMVFQKELQETQKSKIMEKAGENKAAGMAFLEENKKNKDVKVTASGLQYKVIRAGEGPNPGATDMVTVHYRGKLIDGTTFDASYDRGEPVEFGLNQVIPGWTEGLQLMNAGSKYEFYIPSELAYGDQGAGEVIPAGAVLVFEVELLSFKPGSEWKIQE